MKHVIAALCLLCFGSLLSAAETPAWIEKSNDNAQILLTVLAQYSPESAGQIGVDGHDVEVVDLKSKVFERSQKDNRRAAAELMSRLKRETDPLVRQDLQILINAVEDNLRSAELNQRLMLPYFTVSKTVFRGLRGLLEPRIPPERQAKAIDRLRRYSGLERGYEPLTELAKARTRERFGDKTLVGPFRGEVEQDLADTPRLIAGIRDLFKEAGLKGAEEPLAALEKQLTDYDAWVRAEILPRVRANNRLPPEIYADNLRQYGVDISPQELMAKALVGFAEMRNEMQAVARQIALQKKLKDSDYRAVIRELKKKQVYGNKIMPLYQKTLAELEAIIRRENIVTLPDRDAVIRLASEAESTVQPAPHLNPPRLIGNTGEYAEFVLPLNVPAAAGQELRMDDFTHEGSAWTLTVHEARPGHELQFASMIEKGVSMARAIFAFNSVNVEGWALYAEAEMKPYLPLDGQLFSLQARLQRAARAFIDPMVNLGQMTPEQAKSFLMEEVVLSEAMAKQEVDRYTFRAPGQATSYFYGYQRLMQTRQLAEVALRDKFDRRSFHDFVLSQGLLPPDLLQKAVWEQYLPSRRGG